MKLPKKKEKKEKVVIHLVNLQSRFPYCDKCLPSSFVWDPRPKSGVASTTRVLQRQLNVYSRSSCLCSTNGGPAWGLLENVLVSGAGNLCGVCCFFLS